MAAIHPGGVRTITGQTVVVAGASRGIGLGLVQRFLEKGNKVIATARQVENATKLQDLLRTHPGHLRLLQLDVSNYSSICGWAEDLKKTGTSHVDVLVNNAGVYTQAMQLHEFTPDDFINTFQTNTFGPFFVTQQLQAQGLLGGDQHSIVVNISSVMASHQDQTVSSKAGGRYAYRSSKAALGAINKALAMDLGPQNVDCVLLHPGYVKTDMNNGNGWIEIEDSTRGMIDVLESGRDLNGKFYAYDGAEIPW